MSHLFSPVAINKLNLVNRIIIPPMCQYSAIDGLATSWHTIHYGSLAFSGAGLLIFEATAVSPEGRISNKDLGLWDDETENALASVVHNVKTHSPMPLGIQLAHAGRKASMPAPWLEAKALSPEEDGWLAVAPSAIPFHQDYAHPAELTQQDIDRIIQAFVDAAKRSDKIGFDLVEVHAAHGYLLHEFLSPLSNQREDQYGGSLENRMRLTLEVFRAVRDVFPKDKAVGIRISATDWVSGGWDLDQSIALCKQLQIIGCDFIHVSSGGLSAQQQIPVGPNYQVPFADQIKAVVNIPVIAVGLITEPEQAEAIIATGQADMVALARGILYDPRWPWHAAAKLGAQVSVPPQYWRSEPRQFKGLLK